MSVIQKNHLTGICFLEDKRSFKKSKPRLSPSWPLSIHWQYSCSVHRSDAVGSEAQSCHNGWSHAPFQYACMQTWCGAVTVMSPVSTMPAHMEAAGLRTPGIVHLHSPEENRETSPEVQETSWFSQGWTLRFKCQREDLASWAVGRQKGFALALDRLYFPQPKFEPLFLGCVAGWGPSWKPRNDFVVSMHWPAIHRRLQAAQEGLSFCQGWQSCFLGCWLETALPDPFHDPHWRPRKHKAQCDHISHTGLCNGCLINFQDLRG